MAYAAFWHFSVGIAANTASNLVAGPTRCECHCGTDGGLAKVLGEAFSACKGPAFVRGLRERRLGLGRWFR